MKLLFWRPSQLKHKTTHREVGADLMLSRRVSWNAIQTTCTMNWDLHTQQPLRLSLYRRTASLIAEKQQSYYRQILYWLRCKLSFFFFRDMLRRSGLPETCVLIEFLLPVVVHVLCTHGFFVITNANSHIYTKYARGMQLFFFDMLHAWQRSTRQAQVRCRAISETSRTSKT